MFTEEQKSLLSADLDRSNVKERSQSGRKLSYVEGWHAIAEANRIFGFDAWDRETVEIKCVAEKPRKIGQGQNQRDGYGVSYIAKVRVTVDGRVREGVGAGHGIDADVGLAHESAIKEAETDAMKRALMTFGNPFGLALYDKTQEHVASAPKGVENSGLTKAAPVANDANPFDDEPVAPDYEDLLARFDADLAHQLTNSGVEGVIDKHARKWGDASPPKIQDRAVQIARKHHERIASKKKAA